jgi:hypothetical protein
MRAIYRRYIDIIGAKADNASDIQNGLMVEARCNDLLYADFPEICHAVRHIDGIGQRATGQTHMGRPTHIRWNSDGLTFPMIEGSVASGAIIESDGLGAAIRGKHVKLADGTTLRPDLALLDDPQTEESAASVTQCDKLEGIIEKAVLGLSGPDKKIAALMACTIIEPNDLSARFLDHKRHPEWRGECFRMVNKWPDEQDGMWQEYAEFRRGERGGEDRGEWEKLANDFYAENREAMDAGADVSWEDRKFDDELSALQHAENLLIDRGKMAFYAEYQNDPQEAKPALYKITAEDVVGKLNGVEHMKVPKGCAFLVCGVDVNINERGLNWVVLGVMGDMTAFVVDYGKYPEGTSVALRGPDEPEAVAVFRGLKELMGILASKHYMYEDKRVPVQLVMYDCSYQMTTVFRFVEWIAQNARNFAAGIKSAVCSRGKESKRYSQTKAIGRPGNNLHLTEYPGKGKVLIHNTDYWRVHAQKAFLLPVGSPGSLSLYGNDGSVHKRMGTHVASKQLVEFLQGDVSDSYNWHIQPGTYDDLLDALVIACVAASYMGAAVDGENVGVVQKKRAPVVRGHEL